MKIAVAGGRAGRQNYFDALTGAGAEAVPVEHDRDISAYDGLLLPGGADLDPAWYGQANTASVAIDRELDELQFALAKRFIAAGKPILGICRGHQLLNVCLGGTLIQHIASAGRHAREPGSDEDKVHDALARGGILRELYGECFAVNSSHHQAVDRPGEGMIMTLVSDDGITEATEHDTLPILTVQFHPERMSFAHKRPDTVDGELIFRRFMRMTGGKE
ncbi:MAG: gamma-glutamyl-gamma-aminobutyrate hydrolase family protein [Clostridia bacterium]|nr:gamma-glutamyl-gamma-aminobutyrate hydrolase family protein [Clostridia bacterium]